MKILKVYSIILIGILMLSLLIKAMQSEDTTEIISYFFTTSIFIPVFILLFKI